jgi:hypothetical protein
LVSSNSSLKTLIAHVLNIISDDIEVVKWETYDEEFSLRSNSVCLELDVNTEIFNTEPKMLLEFDLFVKNVQESIGNSNIRSVSARLEPGIVGKFFT